MRTIKSEIIEFFKKSRLQNTPFTKGRLVSKPEELFSLQSLQHHLNNPVISPDWCQIAVNGKVLELVNYQCWKTVQKRKLYFLDKREINNAIAQGASIVLEGLDILDAEINSLLSEIDAQMPCALSNCEAFFSQKNNEAYGGHTDSDDVLVIQISGRKFWSLHKPQKRKYIGNSPLDDKQIGPTIDSFSLDPGDILFVKAGVPHRCTTIDSHSLHLSIDLIDRTPNVEQISGLANQIYNLGTAEPHADVEEVAKTYVSVLQSDHFCEELSRQASATKLQATSFRRNINSSSSITALSKFF